MFYYRAGLYDEHSTWFTNTTGRSKLINEITAPTFGKIVFYHQAAKIYSLLKDCNFEIAQEWAYKMAIKKSDAVESSKILKVFDNESLFDCWDDYTVVGQLFPTPILNNNLVWQYLNNRT